MFIFKVRFLNQFYCLLSVVNESMLLGKESISYSLVLDPVRQRVEGDMAQAVVYCQVR
jgi:hypothetical protein